MILSEPFHILELGFQINPSPYHWLPIHWIKQTYFLSMQGSKVHVFFHLHTEKNMSEMFDFIFKLRNTTSKTVVQKIVGYLQLFWTKIEHFRFWQSYSYETSSIPYQDCHGIEILTTGGNKGKLETSVLSLFNLCRVKQINLLRHEGISIKQSTTTGNNSPNLSREKSSFWFLILLP